MNGRTPKGDPKSSHEQHKGRGPEHHVDKDSTKGKRSSQETTDNAALTFSNAHDSSETTASKSSELSPAMIRYLQEHDRYLAFLCIGVKGKDGKRMEETS